MTAALSRRAALTGAVASVAMVGAAVAVAAPVSTKLNGVSARLNRAIALHDRAETMSAHFEASVYDPMRKACLAAIAAAEAELMPAIPHEEVATTFVNVFGDEVRLSTASIGGDATASRVVTDATWADMGDAVWRKAHHELNDLHEARKVRLAEQSAHFARAKEGIESAHGVTAARHRTNTLSDRQWALWKAVVTQPSATIADVVAKLDFMDRTGGDDMPDYAMELLAADLRQLANREALA